MTVFVPNKTGFVLNRTGFVLNMTGFVLNVTRFVLNLTGFVLQMTGFVPNMTEFIKQTKNLAIMGWLYSRSNLVLVMEVSKNKPIYSYSVTLALQCDFYYNIYIKTPALECTFSDTWS